MNSFVPRVALVGISGYGRVYLRHLEAAAARGEIGFAAAVVINPEEDAEACERLRGQGVAIHATWEEMLERWKGKLDLCMLPVPIHLHERVTIAALEAGANVLVEKPMAATVEQARAIQSAERRTNRWVAVGYQDFYAATTRGIHSRLASGYIGKIRAIRWLGLWPRPRTYYSRNNWAGRLTLRDGVVRDSPLNNAMAHFVNLSFYWAGADIGRFAVPAALEAEIFRCFPIESFDTAVVRLTTDNKVSMCMAASHGCPDNQPIRIHIEGETGELTWIHRDEALWKRAGRIERWGIESEEEIVEAMFATVFSRLHDPAARICTSTNAFSQISCVEAVHNAAPIRTIRTAQPHEAEYGGEPIVSLNVENEFRRCLAEKALPSELDLPWASPADHQQRPRRVARSVSPQAGIL